ncbi:hypothetical protein ACLPHM_05005 [Paenalcaligenes sp. Me131]|uniref:hypothetical protein n=1 Tax=Paenalcaligenes sp. Me131 TaxID=3392636 RepID=UPI003D2759A9
MLKLLAFFSPIATLCFAWLSFLFLLFFPPLWLLWPVLVIAAFTINYLGIRHVLGYEGRARLWHHCFNVIESLLLVVMLMRFLLGVSAE